MICHDFPPKNLNENKIEKLVFSFILCGEPAPRVTWNFNTSETYTEVNPVKVKNIGYSYTINFSALSITVCGKYVSIVTKRLKQQEVRVLPTFLNCKWNWICCEGEVKWSFEILHFKAEILLKMWMSSVKFSLFAKSILTQAIFLEWQERNYRFMMMNCK